MRRILDLYLTYAPLTLFKWQMYESQRMRKKWFAFLGDEFEESEDDQDSLKVVKICVPRESLM